MDFVTITDHDTIDGGARDRRPPGRVRLRGADRLVPRRAAGGARPLLRDHPRRPRVAPGPRRATSRRAPSTCTSTRSPARWRIPSTPSRRRSRPRHRRRLAELFPIWEVRNGSRARELNTPAAVYIETHGGTGIGGSDDHAGVDIGRTWTETPPRATPEEFLRHIRAGRAAARGEQGSAAKWAHAAMALASRRALGAGPTTARPRARTRAHGPEDGRAGRCTRATRARGADRATTSGPSDARALLRAWLDAVELDLTRPASCSPACRPTTSATPSSTAARGARHERKLERRSTARRGRRRAAADYAAAVRAAVRRLRGGDPVRAGRRVPRPREGEARPRATASPGASRSSPTRVGGDARRHPHARGDPRARRARLRGRGDRHRPERRPPPAGRGRGRHPVLRGPRGRRAEPAGDRRDARRGPLRPVHLCSPGPAGVAAARRRADRWAAAASAATTPSSPPTRAAHRRRDARARDAARRSALFYGSARSCSRRAPRPTQSLRRAGHRRRRGSAAGTAASTSAASTRRKRDPAALPGEINVLYAGRLTKEKGVDLLAEAFLRARERDPRLHLLLAGGGPEEEALRERLGEHATFLGWLDGEELPAPTRAPTCSCSPAAPTRSAR